MPIVQLTGIKPETTIANLVEAYSNYSLNKSLQVDALIYKWTLDSSQIVYENMHRYLKSHYFSLSFSNPDDISKKKKKRKNRKKKKEQGNSKDNFGNENLQESKDVKQNTKIIELKEKESNLEGQIDEQKEKLKTETENEDEVMNTKSRQMSDLLKMIYNLEDVYS